nr:50S ribosomal protein L28 [Bacillota bacterium]
MSRVCDICGKKPMFGHKVSHAHNVSNRRWMPNLQTVRANVNGEARRLRVCASCLKAGKVEKFYRAAPAKKLSPPASQTNS